MWYKLYKTSDSRPTLTLVTLLVFVLLVRLIVAGVILYPERGDRALNTDQWGRIAKHLVDGYGYVGGHGHENPETAGPNSERGPVPVFFLAGLFWLFGYKLWVVMIANWLCDVGTAYLLYRMARELFPNRPYVAYMSILLWALYIPEITKSNRPYSEPLFTLLVAGHVWTILKLQQRLSFPMAILSGVLLGAASLARGIMLLFLSVVWLSLLLAKGLNRRMFDWQWLKKVVPIGVVLSAAFGLTLLPWYVRNYLVFDAFIPTGTTLGGRMLLTNNINLNTENYVIPHVGHNRTLADRAEEELQARGETLAGKSLIERDRIYQQLALERIKAHPGRYLIVSGCRFLRLWFNVGFGVKPSMASYMVMIANGILLGLFIAAFIGFRGSWLQRSTPIVGLIIYNNIIWVPFSAQVRYIFPVMPYVIMFASYTLTRLIEGVNDLRLSKKRGLTT